MIKCINTCSGKPRAYHLLNCPESSWYKRRESSKTKMKTPQIRMMDLLAGWADFVSAEEENNKDYAEPQVNQKIYDLYQEVGNIRPMTDEKLVECWDKIMAIVEEGR